jgi:hypothetical protein
MNLPTRLTYANVVSTIALFMALTGGVVYAAGKIGSNEIKRGAVSSQKLAAKAVKGGKIAPGSVKTAKIAAGAVGNAQIADDSISPDKLVVPLEFVADPQGGSAPVTSGPDAYPLSNAQWSQAPGQVQVIFGEATATLAYDGSGSGSCQVFFDIRLNGKQVGGGQLSTGSTSAEQVTSSLGAQPEVDPETATDVVMTIQTGSNGDCENGSTIDSSRFRVLSFG